MLILPPFAQCAFEGNIESVLRPPQPAKKDANSVPNKQTSGRK